MISLNNEEEMNFYTFEHAECPRRMTIITSILYVNSRSQSTLVPYPNNIAPSTAEVQIEESLFNCVLRELASSNHPEMLTLLGFLAQDTAQQCSLPVAQNPDTEIRESSPSHPLECQ